MNINHYTYRVTWSPGDNEHVGLCAELPSLSWLPATPEEALAGIRQVVNEVVADMLADDPISNFKASLKNPVSLADGLVNEHRLETQQDETISLLPTDCNGINSRV